MYFVAGNLPEPCGQYLFNCECNAFTLAKLNGPSECLSAFICLYSMFPSSARYFMFLAPIRPYTFLEIYHKHSSLSNAKPYNCSLIRPDRFAHPPLTNPPHCGTL